MTKRLADELRKAWEDMGCVITHISYKGVPTVVMTDSPEKAVEDAARTTIDNLLAGRVGRQTKGDLSDALKRSNTDSALGRAIIGRKEP